MIFVTVGAQMPFTRLVRAVDAWAGSRGRRDVFAQIGPATWRPVNVAWARFLEPDAFRERVRAARVVVAHAGMGSIITALELGKPILVMPRRGSLMETRNDHQVATAHRFEAQGRISVAFDERELLDRLDHLDDLTAAERIPARATAPFLAALRCFANSLPLPAMPGMPLPEVVGDYPTLAAPMPLPGAREHAFAGPAMTRT